MEKTVEFSDQAVIKHCFPACEGFGLLMCQVLNILKVGNRALFVKQWKSGSKVLFYNIYK